MSNCTVGRHNFTEPFSVVSDEHPCAIRDIKACKDCDYWEPVTNLRCTTMNLCKIVRSASYSELERLYMCPECGKIESS